MIGRVALLSAAAIAIVFMIGVGLPGWLVAKAREHFFPFLRVSASGVATGSSIGYRLMRDLKSVTVETVTHQDECAFRYVLEWGSGRKARLVGDTVFDGSLLDGLRDGAVELASRLARVDGDHVEVRDRTYASATAARSRRGPVRDPGTPTRYTPGSIQPD